MRDSLRHFLSEFIGTFALTFVGSAAVMQATERGGNPVAVAPDSRKVVAGFARDDLFTVVLEHFQTDTADYADYVLPATTQLEHWDVHSSYGHTDVLLNRPAISPLGEARPNTQVFRELAARMGLRDACFADDDLTLCRQAFGSRVDFATLERDGFATLPLPEAPLSKKHSQSPPSASCDWAKHALVPRQAVASPLANKNRCAIRTPPAKAAPRDAGRTDYPL